MVATVLARTELTKNLVSGRFAGMPGSWKFVRMVVNGISLYCKAMLLPKMNQRFVPKAQPRPQNNARSATATLAHLLFSDELLRLYPICLDPSQRGQQNLQGRIREQSYGICSLLPLLLSNTAMSMRQCFREVPRCFGSPGAGQYHSSQQADDCSAAAESKRLARSTCTHRVLRTGNNLSQGTTHRTSVPNW